MTDSSIVLLLLLAGHALRPARFWDMTTLIRRAGKGFPLDPDMAGVTWLTDRIARRSAVPPSE